MPTLPLPVGGSSLFGGDLPVSDAADLLVELPPEYQAPENAPIRDALMEAFAEGFIEYQRLAEQAASQCDETRAAGGYLVDLGEESGIPKASGEPDDAYRARLLATPKIVTPQAIYDTVLGVISPYTAALPAVFEPEMDGWFASAGNLLSGFTGNADPSYLERFYPDDEVENDGTVFDGSSPGGTWVSNGQKRCFVVRIPPLEAADGESAFAFGNSYAVTSDEINVFFVGDGTDSDGSESDGTVATSIYGNRLSTSQVYEAVISAVDSIKGQGMVWILLVDPLLP